MEITVGHDYIRGAGHCDRRRTRAVDLTRPALAGKFKIVRKSRSLWSSDLRRKSVDSSCAQLDGKDVLIGLSPLEHPGCAKLPPENHCSDYTYVDRIATPAAPRSISSASANRRRTSTIVPGITSSEDNLIPWAGL